MREHVNSMRTLIALCGLVAASALFADVSYRILGPTLQVTAPADAAGDRVVFVWDSSDRGDDVASWAHAEVVTEAVPTGGAAYELDLAALGVTEGTACGFISTRPYATLDLLGTFNGAYVDTGVKDTDCHAVSFGFYAPAKSADWGYFIGSAEGNGFTIGNNSADFTSWNWAYRNGKKYPRPTAKTDGVNEVVFRNASFTLNGTVVSSVLDAGSVGLSGLTIRIGRTNDSRIQSGWWSHVELAGSDGKNLVAYVPVQAPDGTVGFYDSVSRTFVKPTSGAFTAGTPTGGTVSHVLPRQAFTARDCEPIAVSVVDARLTAHVPAYFAGEQLALVWDDADKGLDPSAWAHAEVLAPVLPAGGGTVTADLRKLGVRNAQTVGVIALHLFEMLDQVKVSEASYVDTGVKDSECTRAAFGFYAEQSDYAGTEWGVFLGTHEIQGGSAGGVLISLENGNPEKWFWKAFGYRASGERPTVSRTSINEAVFSQAAVVVNGVTKKTGLPNAVFGTTGANLYLGRGSIDNRHQAGWWSHLELAGAEGQNLVEFVPVRRAGDGKVGFYDRVSNAFVGPSGSGEIGAGTVTNASVTVVHARATAVARIKEPLTLAVDGPKLVVNVPAGHAQERLTLAWGGRTTVLQEVLPSEGGTYEADLSTLGIGPDDVCTVAAEQNVQLLDRLQMTDRTTYVDTGIPDSLCHGVAFGFLGEQFSEGFAPFLGTYEANNNPEHPGFIVGANNTNLGSWYWAYQGMKIDPRPTVRTDAINEASFADGVFTLNGAVVKRGLPAGPVGDTGRTMHLGCWQPRSRFYYGWWSHVRFTDAGGNAILDFVPAQRAADGAVGFLDRATGAFVTSSGGGAFTAGAVTNAACAFPHAQRTFTLGGLVATATWTGAGAGLADSASWTCRNFAGEPVTGVPTDETEVVVPAGVAFAVPADTPFVCRTLVLPAAFTHDLDIPGVSFSKVAAADLDLAGHALGVTLDADTAQRMTITDSIGGGVLRVAVPEGRSAANASVALTGALKLVKEGDGALVTAKANQSYAGGTEVVAGTLTCSAANGCGAGVFTLAGGTVRNPRDLAHVALTADSSVTTEANRGFELGGAAALRPTLEMNGKTLFFDQESGSTCHLRNLEITGGGLVQQRSGGFVAFDGTMARETDFRITNSVRVDSPSVVRDYVSTSGTGWDLGAATPLKVLGRFAPNGGAWHSVELQDGAVLDLSARADVWSATCRNANFDGTSRLSFAPNATVTVDVGDREPELGDQLVAWPAENAPARGVTFAWSLDLPLYAKRTGLFVMKRPTMAVILR